MAEGRPAMKCQGGKAGKRSQGPTRCPGLEPDLGPGGGGGMGGGKGR